jgi:actin-related protein 3
MAGQPGIPDYPPVVIDVGTGYTKLGYSVNSRPDYIIPTVVGIPADLNTRSVSQRTGTEDLDFYIGFEAQARAPAYAGTNVMKHGQIEDWDKIEQFWEQCIFKYLRCEPEDHAILLTEPPLNSPDNREATAEIMFETFNVPYLYIGMQAMLALAASWTAAGSRSMTGCVVDSGDGVTHVIPVVHGYPISNAIVHVPVAGHEMTSFIAQLLQEREPSVPAHDRYVTAKNIKERFCKVARHPSVTYQMFDKDRAKYITTYTGIDSKTKKPFTCEVGYERFLAPEVWFSPELVSGEYTTPISALIHRAIRMSPIQDRVPLFGNIVLSGGSTTFSGLAERLQRDVQAIVDEELRQNAIITSQKLGREHKAGTVKVEIKEHKRQQYAVWYGGAMLASTGVAFYAKCFTKQQYNDEGPAVARKSAIFGEAAV